MSLNFLSAVLILSERKALVSLSNQVKFCSSSSVILSPSVFMQMLLSQCLLCCSAMANFLSVSSELANCSVTQKHKAQAVLEEFGVLLCLAFMRIASSRASLASG